MRVATKACAEALLCTAVGLADLVLEKLYPGPAAPASRIEARHAATGLKALAGAAGLLAVLACLAAIGGQAVVVPVLSAIGTSGLVALSAVVVAVLLSRGAWRLGRATAGVLQEAHARGRAIRSGTRAACWARGVS